MTAPTVDGQSLVRLGDGDLPRVLELCRRCAAFYELVEGQAADEETAREILGPPAGQVAQGMKHVWGLEDSGRLIAIVELLAGYPAAGEWYVGLLLISPERRGQGLGARLFRAVRSWMAAEGAAMARIVVQQQNPGAFRFWQRQGFAVEREVVSRTGRLEGPVWILRGFASSSA